MKEEKNYCVYKHICLDGMVYVGMTNNIKKRWFKSHYTHKPFIDWIERFGWDNITHEVVYDGLSKEEASRIEDNLIEIHTNLGNSLNNNESGRKKTKEPILCSLIYDSHKMMKKVRREWKKELKREDNIKQRDYRTDYYNKFRNTVEGKIYNRVASYNQWLTGKGMKDEIIETPAEARQKYLDYGYIPDYIKNDDLM